MTTNPSIMPSFRRCMSPRALVIALAVVGTMACQSDNIQSVTPSTSPKMFWGLRNDTRAVTVAIGGQQQLSVVPVAVDGTPIAGLPAPTFTSGDATKVTVSDDGVVTGVAETPGVTIKMSLQAQGVTYTDSTVVAVTPGSATLKAVTITLPPGGAILGLGDPATPLFATAIDVNDQPIPGAAVSVVSLDPDKILLYSFGGPPMAQANVLGKTRIVASTTTYGVTKADTVEFTVQYGTSAQITITMFTPGAPPNMYPNAVLVGVGGTVNWFNSTGTTFNIHFDDPAGNIVGGDISALGMFGFASRQFPIAGTYKFTETGSGVTGTVIVREQPTF